MGRRPARSRRTSRRPSIRTASSRSGPVPVPVALLAQLAQGGAPAAHAARRAGADARIDRGPAAMAHGGPPAATPPRRRAGAAAMRRASTARSSASSRSSSSSRASSPSAARPTTRSSSTTRRSSSKHAQIVKAGEQLFLEDRGSANGTFVRGQRIAAGPARAGRRTARRSSSARCRCSSTSRTSRVNVVVEDQADWAGKPLYEIEAWDLFLEVPDRDNKGEMKVLLDHVSFKALPGRHDRAHGPLGRRQDDAAPRAQRLPAADERAGPHQRRGPLHHLRRPPRQHRLRPAGRHRPPRAHRLRGREVLGALPPAARLLARRRSTGASTRRCATSASRA